MTPALGFEDQFREPTETSEPSPRVSIVGQSSRGGNRRYRGSHGIDPDPNSPLHPDTHWFHHGDVVRGVVASFQTFYKEPWINFGEVPTIIRDHMFGFFQTLITWDCSLDSQVRVAWEAKLDARMRDSVYKARLVLQGCNDIEACPVP